MKAIKHQTIRSNTEHAIEKANTAQEKAAKALTEAQGFPQAAEALITKLETDLRLAQVSVTVAAGIEILASIPAQIAIIRGTLTHLKEAVTNIAAQKTVATTNRNTVDDIRHDRNKNLRKSQHTEDQIAEATAAATAAETAVTQIETIFLHYARGYNNTISDVSKAEQKKISDAYALQQRENERQAKIREEQRAVAQPVVAAAAGELPQPPQQPVPNAVPLVNGAVAPNVQPVIVAAAAVEPPRPPQQPVPNAVLVPVVNAGAVAPNAQPEVIAVEPSRPPQQPVPAVAIATPQTPEQIIAGAIVIMQGNVSSLSEAERMNVQIPLVLDALRLQPLPTEGQNRTDKVTQVEFILQLVNAAYPLSPSIVLAQRMMINRIIAEREQPIRTPSILAANLPSAAITPQLASITNSANPELETGLEGVESTPVAVATPTITPAQTKAGAHH
jgi:hypothetical protein